MKNGEIHVQRLRDLDLEWKMDHRFWWNCPKNVWSIWLSASTAVFSCRWCLRNSPHPMVFHGDRTHGVETYLVGCFIGCSLEGKWNAKISIFSWGSGLCFASSGCPLAAAGDSGGNLGIRDKFCSCEGFQLLSMWADDMSYIHTFIVCNISTFDLNTQRFNHCYSCLWIAVVSVWSTCKYMWGISCQMILKYFW